MVSIRISSFYSGALSILASILTVNSYAAPRTFQLIEDATDGLGVYYCFYEVMACGRPVDIERRLVTNIGDFDNQLYTAIKKDLVLVREGGNSPKFPFRVYKACVGDCLLPMAYQSDEHKAETERAEIAERTRVALEEIERQIALEERALEALNSESI
ncbi:MAG: hypothetical protein ABIQ95_08180 [Bdellovibrionia bacterium]